MKMNTQTSNRYKVTIESDSYIPIFETYAKFRFFLAKTKDYISKPIVTKTKKNYTLLKSPHVNKKSREQYQKTKFKKSFQFQTLNPKLIFLMRGQQKVESITKRAFSSVPERNVITEHTESSHVIMELRENLERNLPIQGYVTNLWGNLDRVTIADIPFSSFHFEPPEIPLPRHIRFLPDKETLLEDPEHPKLWHSFHPLLSEKVIESEMNELVESFENVLGSGSLPYTSVARLVCSAYANNIQPVLCAKIYLGLLKGRLGSVHSLWRRMDVDNPKWDSWNSADPYKGTMSVFRTSNLPQAQVDNLGGITFYDEVSLSMRKAVVDHIVLFGHNDQPSFTSIGGEMIRYRVNIHLSTEKFLDVPISIVYSLI